MATDGHDTTQLMHPRGEVVAIDTDIAPLIAALWQLGVHTEQSCQESQPGFVWIAFPTTQAALDFVRAVDLTDENLAEEELDDYDSLVNRALSPTVASPGGSPPDAWAWRWTGQPYPGEGVFSMAVDFPRSDLAELTHRAETKLRTGA